MNACCAEVRVALSLWDVRSDLPERLALHVASCRGCRADFDGRFTAVPLPMAQIDPAVRERLLGRDRRPLAPLLLAAVLVIGLGLGLLPRADAGRIACAEPSQDSLTCEDVAFGEPLDQECVAG